MGAWPFGSSSLPTRRTGEGSGRGSPSQRFRTYGSIPLEGLALPLLRFRRVALTGNAGIAAAHQILRHMIIQHLRGILRGICVVLDLQSPDNGIATHKDGAGIIAY